MNQRDNGRRTGTNRSSGQPSNGQEQIEEPKFFWEKERRPSTTRPSAAQTNADRETVSRTSTEREAASRTSTERETASRTSFSRAQRQIPVSNWKARRAREVEKREKKLKTIRLVSIAALAVIVIALIIVIVSCSVKQKKKAAAETETATTEAYIEATITRDEYPISDDAPVVANNGWDYTLYVNCALNVVTVYENDSDHNPTKAVKCFICSTARDGYETYQGDFILGEVVQPWCHLADGTKGQNSYRIIDGVDNDIMFHTVPYTEDDKSTLETEEFNKLGEGASMGCIRMMVADLNWIVENTGYGTQVHIYTDADEQLPIAKPTAYYIPEDISPINGWDPTDPDSANPWHSYTYSMEIPNSLEITAGSSETDLKSLIQSNLTAVDSYGNNVSGYMTYTGTHDLNTPGTYTVTVSIKLGPISATKDVKIIVSESDQK